MPLSDIMFLFGASGKLLIAADCFVSRCELFHPFIAYDTMRNLSLQDQTVHLLPTDESSIASFCHNAVDDLLYVVTSVGRVHCLTAGTNNVSTA